MNDALQLYFPFLFVIFIAFCCWFDRYCIKKHCDKEEPILPIERNNNIRDISEDDISDYTSGDDYSDTSGCEYTDTSGCDYTDTSGENIDTSGDDLMIKPDYDEDTEDEYGRPLE